MNFQYILNILTKIAMVLLQVFNVIFNLLVELFQVLIAFINHVL